MTAFRTALFFEKNNLIDFEEIETCIMVEMTFNNINTKMSVIF